MQRSFWPSQRPRERGASRWAQRSSKAVRALSLFRQMTTGSPRIVMPEGLSGSKSCDQPATYQVFLT